MPRDILSSVDGRRLGFDKDDFLIINQRDDDQVILTGVNESGGVVLPSIGGAIDLPARIRNLINGPVFVDPTGQIVLGFDPSSLVPLPSTINSTVYYASPTGSDSNNGTTWALAKRSIHACITLGNAAAVPYTVMIAAGTYDRSNSFTNGSVYVIPTQACRFTAVGGRVVCHTAGALSWTLDQGTTYSATRSNVGKVIDWLNNDSWGDPVMLAKVSSLALCRATPGSWFLDNNTTVYVNRADGAAVTDTNTAALLHNANGIHASNSGNTWLEGITQLGGSVGALRMKDNVNGRVYARDCKFLMANEGTGNAVDCVQSQNIGLAVFERCVAGKGDKDGFNFQTLSSSVPAAVLVDCAAYENGLGGVSVSCNGVTMHAGGALLDIRGRYTRNRGGDCAHTNTSTVAAHIGTVATRGYGDIAQGGIVPPDTGFHAITGATVHMFGCVGNRLVECTSQFANMSLI